MLKYFYGFETHDNVNVLTYSKIKETTKFITQSRNRCNKQHWDNVILIFVNLHRYLYDID